MLLLLLFSGSHSNIITVSKVSVKAGGSVSIPCLYELPYRNHVKYLCKGKYWTFCSYKVKTNQFDNSGKSSISDDPDQRVFTVTINNLTAEDHRYWCAVEIEKGKDVKQGFQLLVSTGKIISHTLKKN